MKVTMAAGLMLALLAGPLTAVFAQPPAGQKTSALAGMVRDENGHPIPNALLSVDGRTLRATSNDSGQFFLGGIPSGRSGFTLSKIGYSIVRFEIELQPDTTLVVNIPMRPVQSLPGVEVSSDRMSARLLQMGYYDRKSVGIGSFVDPARIERLATGAIQASALFRDVRGIEVRCRGSRCTVRPSSTAVNSCLAVMVNKIFVQGEIDDNVAAAEVYAIEVYERSVLVPLEFTVPARFRNCGVIAVWTRNFAEPGR